MTVTTAVDPTDVLAVLEAAREWLSDPEHWTQGAFFRDASGHEAMRCDNAVCTCGQGAMALVAGINITESLGPLEACFDAVAEVAGSALPYLNDHVGYEAVLAAYDEAIATERRRRGVA
jgi:hypothetical protein